MSTYKMIKVQGQHFFHFLINMEGPTGSKQGWPTVVHGRVESMR